MREPVSGWIALFILFGYYFTHMLFLYSFRGMPFWGDKDDHLLIRLYRSIPGQKNATPPFQDILLRVDRAMSTMSVAFTLSVGILLYIRAPGVEAVFTFYAMGVFFAAAVCWFSRPRPSVSNNP